MKDLYKITAKCVTKILERDYNLTASEAKKAVKEYPLKSIFEENPEIAGHTSFESWAKRVFVYYSSRNNKT